MNNLTLKEEVTLLRSAVAGMIGKDREGMYRPEFVAEVFASLKRKPTDRFSTSEAFMKAVERA